MSAHKFARATNALFVSWFFLALTIATPLAAAQVTSPPAQLLSARDLQADFAVFRRAYEELHPGLYRYNTPAQMASNFDALRAELSHDQTLAQAYLAFSVFLAKLKCGHSYANFYNQTDEVANALLKSRDRVPFYFRWLDRRMIVTRDFSGDARMKPGAEVLSINGVSAGHILARLLTVARADGSNDAKRVSYMEVRGFDNYEAFDIYFSLFFPQMQDSQELIVKDPLTHKLARVHVRPLTYDERLAPIKSQVEARKGGDTQVWEFRQLDARMAYLRMPSWALFDSKWDWQKFLADTFAHLAEERTANLVIDLRGNEGGESVGDAILSHLVTQDLRLSQFRRLVRYQKVPADLAPYLKTWDRSFFDWGAAAVEPHDGFYRLTRYDDDASGNVIKPVAPKFAGRTFILVDASNSSATFEFAQAAQQNHLATLVGQPTGGNQRGINGGAFFFLRLPNSKIEIDLPLIGLFPDGTRPDAGLLPDVLVPTTPQDIARGVDAELDAVRQLTRAPR